MAIDFLKKYEKPEDYKYLMLNDIIYHKPNRDNEFKDVLNVIYTDTRTREKKMINIIEPEIEIYFAKEDKRNYTYNKAFEFQENLDCHKVKYKNVISYIAKHGDQDIKNKYKAYKTSNYRGLKNIHQYRYVYGSDIDIEALYRIYWDLLVEKTRPKDFKLNKKITKAFMDIETDIIDLERFPEPGECPVFMNSLFDQETMTMYTFLLRNPKNPLIEKFEKDIKRVQKRLHDMFDESYGVINYEIYMYDREIDLIQDIFNLINKLKRDYVMIWNMDFDANFLVARLEKLGRDPVQAICHKDFIDKNVYYYKDRHNFDVPNRGDYFFTSTYTKFIDQMILYGALRKVQSTQRSFKLNAIAQKEIKDSKLDYSESSDMRHLPYIDYELYVIYNIKDVLLQYGIERRTQDLDNLYTRTLRNVTPINKAFKQTVFLKNRGYLEYLLMGLVMGNNINVDHAAPPKEEKGQKKKDVKFSGALVGNPELNGHTGALILGHRSKYVFKYVIDMDFSSMYPSIDVAFNIFVNTLIGKLYINEEPEDLVRKLNMVGEELNNPKVNDGIDDEDDGEEVNDGTSADTLQIMGDKTDYGEEATIIDDNGKVFIENLTCGDKFSTGSRWFNLPTVEELFEEFDKLVS